MERPAFSLIFLTWNSKDCIENTVESVRSQDFSDYEIIIVDNDSDDGTINIVRELQAKDMVVIENDTNLGFSAGTNLGVENASGEYICCYNDDTYFPEGYLSTLDSTVTSGAVWTTARINHRVSENNQSVRVLTDHRFPVPYIVDGMDGVVAVNYVPGDGLIVPREILNQLGENLFDSSIPPKGEDVDLSLQLQSEGIPMLAILNTHSIHPDKGFYSPTLSNLLNHFKNVHARFTAYKKNNASFGNMLRTALSTITVPLIIYFEPFPRSNASFRRFLKTTNPPSDSAFLDDSE
jgi:GT2 family glycosyltransferase